MTTSLSSSSTFFNSILWTSTLLTSPSIITKPATSRTPKSSSEDSLIATTLLTSNTIPHCLIYYAATSLASRSSESSDPSTLNKINILFNLGTGMNGHPHILHGGITAVLMDESMGMALQCAIEHAQSFPTTPSTALPTSTGSFTKTLNVEFMAPVRTPGIVLMEVEVAERRGRGVRLVARLLQKEGRDEEVEGGLVVCARGEGVFVTPRSVKL